MSSACWPALTSIQSTGRIFMTPLSSMVVCSSTFCATGTGGGNQSIVDGALADDGQIRGAGLAPRARARLGVLDPDGTITARLRIP
jgi:hypothetical protein